MRVGEVRLCYLFDAFSEVSPDLIEVVVLLGRVRTSVTSACHFRFKNLTKSLKSGNRHGPRLNLNFDGAFVFGKRQSQNNFLTLERTTKHTKGQNNGLAFSAEQITSSLDTNFVVLLFCCWLCFSSSKTNQF